MRRPDAALLLDLDGTLVDTREANFRSYRDSLAEIGRLCTSQEFAPHFGRHWRDFLPLLAGSTDADLLQRVHRRKQALYPGHLGCVRLNPALVALLRSSRTAWSIGLVTTASRANVDALLGHFGLTGDFDVVITGDDVDEPKPAPHGYARCLHDLAADPQRSLAFEDSATGIAAARAAGLQVVVVTEFTA